MSRVSKEFGKYALDLAKNGAGVYCTMVPKAILQIFLFFGDSTSGIQNHKNSFTDMVSFI